MGKQNYNWSEEKPVMELLRQAIKTGIDENVDIEIKIKCPNAIDDVYVIHAGVSTRVTEVDEE